MVRSRHFVSVQLEFSSLDGASIRLGSGLLGWAPSPSPGTVIVAACEREGACSDHVGEEIKRGCRPQTASRGY